RGIPADKLARYRERFSQGLYADLLVDLEASTARAPFWLDGQRVAWECRQELNADLATRELEIQLALFLKRLPGLDELRFRDGTTPPWEEALQNVLPQLRKDGLKPAVQQLKKGLATARGGRERFFWQLTLARLCYQAKKYELAKTQLETLDQTLKATGLADWEP